MPRPEVRKRGSISQLMVDGEPFIALAGELHNSSASSPAYMSDVWDRLQRWHLTTVIGTACWDLTEPEEGVYDFTVIDDQIHQARQRGMRLIITWFGAFKNGESTYAPSWVRRDEARFPRAQKDPASTLTGRFPRKNPVLSLFGAELRKADARAFAALMRHISGVDPRHTVVMVQVENEVGLLGDSRDRSALARAAWEEPVPAALLDHFQARADALHPHLRDLWDRQGRRTAGPWAEVFGTDGAADELFMAWSFGQYVEHVAAAGARCHPLPLFTNAWLGPHEGAPLPGLYPSGGPVSRLIDVWQAAAPTLGLLAPDIYIPEFEDTLAAYRHAGNPILIPETRVDAGNLFVALGEYSAIGYAPFGVEDGPEGHEIFEAYRVLAGMTQVIAAAQTEGRIRGTRLAPGARVELALGDITVTVAGPFSTLGLFGPGTGADTTDSDRGYALLIRLGPEELLVVGKGVNLDFQAGGLPVEIDSAREGQFIQGTWVPGRSLNGDERFFLFPNDELRVVRIGLLRRTGPSE
ncbi:glycoside hydrolase family 35 [Pseudofrankia inefficax]|uniref:Glycoside hydrolase family 35 n=2 Tax=Pseudofrankia inefficax (strain DSM 45817 / CECT 9037 / DDB 130130 / EuI1c) TaxID=298654 RepID=E3IUE6_PSEI1|nr:glycoside hydrolase family 35 [Pseudofrankia inefficax]